MADEIPDEETEYVPGIDDESGGSTDEPAEPDDDLDVDESEAAEGDDDLPDEAEGVDAEDSGAEDLEPGGPELESSAGGEPLFYELGEYVPIELTDAELAANPDEGEIYSPAEGSPDDDEWDAVPSGGPAFALMAAAVEDATPDETIASMTVDDFLTENESTNDQTDVDIDIPVAYEIHGKPPKGSWQVLGVVAAEQTEAEVAGLPSGVGWVFRVRTVFSDGTFGQWSAETAVDLPKDLLAPPVPSLPKLKAGRGVVTVTWDGKGSGGVAQPADYKHTVIWQSLDGSAGSWNNMGTMVGAGTFHVTNLAYGQLNYFSLSSRDLMGNESSRSASASAILKPLVEEPDIAKELNRIDSEYNGVITEASQLGEKLSQAQKDIIAAGGRLDTLGTVTLPAINKSLSTLRDDLGTVGQDLTKRLDGAFIDISKVDKTAGSALAKADSAMTAAGSKSRVLYSLNEPSGTASHSDIWRQVKSNGDVIGQWYWSASNTWTKTMVSTEVISNVDIGKLTAGTANISNAVIDKLWADVISARKMTTQNLAIGSLDNLVPSPRFELESDWPYWLGSADTKAFVQATGGRDEGPRMAIPNNAANPTAPAGRYSRSIPVEPGASYRVSGWFKTGFNTNQVAQLRIRFPKAGATGGDIVRVSVTSESAAANEWVKLEAEVKAPATATTMQIAGASVSTSVWVYFDDMRVNRMSDGQLIVDGSVVAQHITASEEMSAKVAKFLKLEVVDLVATGSAKMSSAVVDKLWTEVVHAKKITTDMLAVGSFDNMIPDANFEDPVLTSARLAASSEVVAQPRSSAVDGRNYMTIPPSSTGNVSLRLIAESGNRYLPVEPGAVYRIRYLASASSGTVETRPIVAPKYTNAASYLIPVDQSTYVSVTSGWKWIEYTWTAPDNATGAYFLLQRKADETTGSLYVKSPVATRMSGGELIVDGAITTDKIFAKAITAGKMAINSVTADSISGGSVTAIKIDTDAVTASKIKADSVTAVKIATDAVTAEKIKADSVTAIKIATDAVTAGKIKADSVTAVKIATDAIETRHLKSDSITAGKIATDAITAKQLHADAINGKTITGATLRTSDSPSTNGGHQIDYRGIRAWSPSGKLTVFISSTTGNASISGSMTAGKGGAAGETLVAEDIYEGRPGVRFNHGLSAGVQPHIVSIGADASSYPARSLVIMGSEAVANSSGRATIVLEQGGNWKIGPEYGTRSGFGVGGSGDTIEVNAKGVLSLGADGHAAAMKFAEDSTGQFVQSVRLWNRRYTSAANVHITSNGVLGLSSSSLKYKVAVDTMEEIDDQILSLRAATWYDKGEAESVAEYVRCRAEGEAFYDEDGEPRYETPDELRRIPGVIAEEVHAAGLKEFIHYSARGEIEGVMYDRLGVALIPVVARQRDRIISLESRMSELEAQLAA